MTRKVAVQKSRLSGKWIVLDRSKGWWKVVARRRTQAGAFAAALAYAQGREDLMREVGL